MDHSNPRMLVSTDWLDKHLRDPDLCVLDGSWYLPELKRDARAEFETSRIPGSRFFDIDDISDRNSPLPHMAPPPEQFVAQIRSLGIGDGHQIVVYDGSGISSAARVWWLFRLMGHERIAVLDGGFPKWCKENRPISDLDAIDRVRHFTPRVQNQLVSHRSQVAAASQLGSAEIIDARPSERFNGNEPEPRQGLRRGNIPSSCNLPAAALVASDGTMKTAAELTKTFEAAGIDLAKPAIATCGSGVMACVIALALESLGKHDWAVYDGSWSEWGASSNDDSMKGAI
ncbi:MAG: 3-mercaptopyruvate sulfurtransferase [Aestuariivita sp.]|nr:3-mercaptopyruvate sulfurtransferase [Aestuariivita sp.]MCY4202987.1 3-mercaptopyruvate sulfurtransferase [Aestuariivita sp.]MCY4289033.1 3-mercaptopyruvate sulfurtransferase [Aestuariivita sp.]MCY4347461.1 3-mercaptopyruvate sulfurtransferase [Aestuariivita sp.]